VTIQFVRDFIYLDINRIKSIISQLDKGLISETQTENGNSGSLNVGTEGKVPLIGSASIETDLQKYRKSLETKSPHDYIYNRVEDLLLKNKMLLQIPNEDEYICSSKVRELIDNTSFVLTKGKVAINDYSQLLNFLDKYDDLMKVLARSEISKDSTRSQQNIDYQNKYNEYKNKLSPDTRKDIITFINIFYKDRIVIKITPFKELPDFRFVGNLDKAYFRDCIESIIYKYGTAPISDWTMFCQIASIPPEKRSNDVSHIAGSAIESAFHEIFDAYRILEPMVQSVSYPEIAVTPIAIYRE
jgi:hypothetical protein